MNIGRTIPPAAAPLGPGDLWYGARGLLKPAPAVAALEREFRQYFGARYVFPVSSGSAALMLSLKALASTSARTEVILPAYTCYTVPAAIVHAGLRPILCDLDRSSFDLDHEQLTGLITERTLCVIVHHLFGIPSNVDRVRTLCAGRGVTVIEDAAQACGVESHGRLLGTGGDVGIFSFGRGKHVTCGEGGLIVTNEPRLAEAIAAQYASTVAPNRVDMALALAKVVVMYVCIRPWLYWIPASLPFLKLGETHYPRRIAVRRLSGMHAGLLSRMRLRVQRARRWRAASAGDFARRLYFMRTDAAPMPLLRLPVYASSRDEKRRLSVDATSRRLGITRGYPTAVNEIPEIRRLFTGQSFPNAARVADHLLTVPTHHWLTPHDRSAITEHLRDAVGAMCPLDDAVLEHEQACEHACEQA